jgi:hypothetical protein
MLTQADLDSAKLIFESLPFYRTLLHNPDQKAYLLGVTVSKDSINSKYRSILINDIVKETKIFETNTQIGIAIKRVAFY